MNSELSLKVYGDFEKVRYYSLHFEGEKDSLTKKYFDKFKNDAKFSEDADALDMWIAQIGEIYGAREVLFRPEDDAKALPPPPAASVAVTSNDYQSNPPLRLYCIRLSDELVILLGGDEKTAGLVKNCPKCFPHFKFANSIANQIKVMIDQGECNIKGRRIQQKRKFKLEDKHGIKSL